MYAAEQADDALVKAPNPLGQGCPNLFHQGWHIEVYMGWIRGCNRVTAPLGKLKSALSQMKIFLI